MKKRRLLLWTWALVMLGACGVTLWLNVPRPGVTRSNYERIREGMTLADVGAILGGPPGNYQEGRGTFLLFSANGPEGSSPWLRDDVAHLIWWGPDVTILLAVSPDGRVLAKHCSPYMPSQPSFWDRLRRLLPW